MSRLLHSLPRAAGGRKMDSIVREVVSRSGVQPRLPESPTQTMGVGEESAREAADELRSVVQGADMVFITCGLGGGTGTGGAPVLAQLSKEAGALTIAICTFPFRAEGAIRAENAEYGLEKLRNFADTVVVIPNDKLLELVPRLALNAAFKVADDVLMRAIKGIAEIITKSGLVNLDFNDIKTIMKGGGVAMIGLGESDRDNRSEEAIEEAINSPLIDVDITAATGALVNVRGGNDMSVAEAEKGGGIVQGRIAPNGGIIWGAGVDPTLGHKLRGMLILTGGRSKQILGPGEHARAHGGGDIVRGGSWGATGAKAGGGERGSRRARNAPAK